MKTKRATLMLAVLFWGSFASSQQPNGSAPAPNAVADTGTLTLKEGTQVKLKFLQPLSSKTARTDDRVEFVLDEDVKTGDTVVIKKGARAVGTISNAKKNGMMGKPGELNLTLDYLSAGDRKVQLRGSQGKQGDDKTGATVALVIAFGVFGFMKHGKNVEIKAGDPLIAYVGQDIALAPVQ